MDLQDYLNYFKRMRNQQMEWTSTDREDGILQMGYPKYDDTMLKFAQEFPDSPYYDRNPRKTLKPFRIKPRVNHETMGQAMLTANIKVYEAMLSLIIYYEKFDSGSWARSLQAGYLYQLTAGIVNLEQTAK